MAKRVVKKAAKKVAKKKATNNLTLSSWAIRNYGKASSMCREGRAVYNKVVELEGKGFGPVKIFAYFKKLEAKLRDKEDGDDNNLLSYLTENATDSSDLDDRFHKDQAKSQLKNILEGGGHAPELSEVFKKALQAEIDRLGGEVEFKVIGEVTDNDDCTYQFVNYNDELHFLFAD